MNREKWLDLLDNIKIKFQITEEGKEIDEEIPGSLTEYVVFDCPLGKIKATRLVRPRIIDKKTNFSRRIGSETAVSYVYDETDLSERLVLEKWDEGAEDWREFDGDLM